jgi:hypothetical protein
VADKHPFLSDGWFTEAEKLIAEHAPQAHGANVVMNLEVAEGERTVQFHMGARDGATLFGRGHTEADVTLSTDIDTARAVFLDGNPQAGMQAFMAGKVKVQGDMTKLMAAQAGGGGGGDELTKALQSITE